MEISGKIIEVLPLKSGTSQKGEWASQQYVLETPEQYPQRFLFEVFGNDKINSFAIQKEEVVTVSFNTDAREYNGSWYGANRAWKVVKQSPTAEGTTI